MAEYNWYVDPDASGAGTGVDWTNAYNSLEAALSAKEADITGGDQHIFHCRSSSGTNDTTAASVDTWVTDSEDYVKIIVDQSDRHGGVWNDSKYVLYNSSTTCLSVSVDYTQTIGLQIEDANASSTYKYGIYVSSCSDCRFESLIIRHTNTAANNIGLRMSGGSGLTGFVIYNCVFYNFSWHNCYTGSTDNAITIVYCTSYGAGGNGYWSAYNDTTIYNSIAYNNTSDDFSDSFTAASNYNASEDGSEPGANGWSNSVDGYTPDFVNTGAGTENFHLQVTSDCIGAGTDLSGLGYTNDIDGDARDGSTPDIGADEYVVAEEGRTTKNTDAAPLGDSLGMSFRMGGS